MSFVKVFIKTTLEKNYENLAGAMNMRFLLGAIYYHYPLITFFATKLCHKYLTKSAIKLREYIGKAYSHQATGNSTLKKKKKRNVSSKTKARFM